jgi:hypothetical protein
MLLLVQQLLLQQFLFKIQMSMVNKFLHDLLLLQLLLQQQHLLLQLPLHIPPDRSIPSLTSRPAFLSTARSFRSGQKRQLRLDYKCALHEYDGKIQ